MAYELKDLGHDRFELLRIESVSLGVLTDRHIAERFADFLTSLDEGEQQQAELFAALDARPTAPVPHGPEGTTLTFVPTPTPVDADENIAQKPAALAPQADVIPAANTPPVAVNETPMEEAFRRLRGGEALGVIADDIGIPMTRLRSLWAHKCRGMKDDPAQAADPMECTTCGRQLRARSPDGLCARCARDIRRA